MDAALFDVRQDFQKMTDWSNMTSKSSSYFKTDRKQQNLVQIHTTPHITIHFASDFTPQT